MQHSEYSHFVGTKRPEYRSKQETGKSLRPSSNHQFDFEVGSLVRSPCIGCPTRPDFPKCIDQCNQLDQIHTVLANTVSCTRRR